MAQPNSEHPAGKSGGPVVSKKDYLFLASLLGGRDTVQRVFKRDPHGEALRAAGEFYEHREYVAAYECLKPAYDKIVADMQRILARNLEFEANKIATRERKPLAAAKEHVQKLKVHAQEVIDHFDKLLHDLQSKPLVRVHMKSRRSTSANTSTVVEEAAPTILNSASETRLDTAPVEVASGGRHFAKAGYAPPETGCFYSVRDKTKGERVVRIVGVSPDRTLVQVEILEEGSSPKPPIQLAVDSLARQAAKGWCSLLIPVAETVGTPAAESPSTVADTSANVVMRLDIQNFSRCCADIVRANIKFDTQLIKDLGDGPFRAGNYEQSFRTFEQFAVGFTSAVANSRREIADGRRKLMAEKGSLSGKEIQERTAALVRHEQLINTAEREFTTILEGLRMYLRALQG